MTEFNLMRVIYGKKDQPLDKREYTVKEFNTSAVGTMEEINELLKKNGYTNVKLILHDNISPDPPIHSIDCDLTKKKPIIAKRKTGWQGESLRHAMSAKGLPSGKKQSLKKKGIDFAKNNIICPKCGGSGTTIGLVGDDMDEITCPACGGKGTLQKVK